MSETGAFVPAFSIVIPTNGSGAKLQTTLDALSRLDYPAGRFEVVVVLDGGAPFESQPPVRVLANDGRGPAAARNCGARQARGEYLLFLDDDCTLHSNHLSELAHRFQGGCGLAIGARTVNAVPDNLYSAATQIVADCFAEREQDGGRTLFLPSNCFACSASDFGKLGGFDTSYPLAAGEDRDLCARYLAAGVRLLRADELTVMHRHALSLGSFLRKHFHYGRGAVAFRRAEGTAVKPAPGSFYGGLLAAPWRDGVSWRAATLTVLVAVSQIATAAGACVELVKKGKRG